MLEITVLDVSIFLTLILLEGALSLDNAAILAALTRPLPGEERRKALLYGLIGAYVFRVLAILLFAYILHNPILKYLGGGYLVFLTAKHFLQKVDEKGIRPVSRIFGLTAFWSTVVWVELADIAFAIDQILVAVAFTDKVVLIIAAAMVAILLLRLSAFYMARLMDWFPSLEHVAYIVVGIVGVKLIAEAYLQREPVPKWLMVTVTFSLFLIPILGKVLRDIRARQPRKPNEDARAEPAEPAP